MALALVSGTFIQRYSQTLRPGQSSPSTAHRCNPKHQRTEGKSKPQPTNPAVGPGGCSANAGGTKPSAKPTQALASSSEGGRQAQGCRGSLPCCLPRDAHRGSLPARRRRGQCRPGAGRGLAPPSYEEGMGQCWNRCPGDLTKAPTRSARAGGQRPCESRTEPPGHCKASACLLPSPQPGSKGEREQQECSLTPSSGPAPGRTRSEGVWAWGKVPAAGAGSLAKPGHAGGEVGARVMQLPPHGLAPKEGTSCCPRRLTPSLGADPLPAG